MSEIGNLRSQAYSYRMAVDEAEGALTQAVEHALPAYSVEECARAAQMSVPEFEARFEDQIQEAERTVRGRGDQWPIL